MQKSTYKHYRASLQGDNSNLCVTPVVQIVKGGIHIRGGCINQGRLTMGATLNSTETPRQKKRIHLVREVLATYMIDSQSLATSLLLHQSHHLDILCNP